MYDLNLLAVNHALVKSIRLVRGAQRMLGPRSDVCDDLEDLERELREAAGECQRVLELVKADGDRPLLNSGPAGEAG